MAENGLIPYSLIRMGIRTRLRNKLKREASRTPNYMERLRVELGRSPVASHTAEANQQHYELPPEFFKLALGKHLKYSSCYWPEDYDTLDAAERASLEQVASRARLEDGQRVLDMGCGWGSFTLWAAKEYPNSTFTAVSNSNLQRTFIEKQATERVLPNVKVITADMNVFEPSDTYDRIVSIEMLEHMSNYEALFERVASWLNKNGRFFAHVFSHRNYAYKYDASNESEWMARYFFTGGIMPSHSLLPSFDKHLKLIDSWKLEGTHYQKTCEAWLMNMNSNSERIKEIFSRCYGEQNANRWLWRWRLFFLACSELFGYKNGKEWGVSHYLFKSGMR